MLVKVLLHVEIQYYYILELVEDEIVELEYCSTEENRADIFTNAVGSMLFKRHIEALGAEPRVESV